MHEVFSKIIERFEDKRKTAKQLIMENPQDELDKIQTQAAEDFASAYKDAIEIVKQEVGKYNNGWIPCIERIPKYGEVVMCCCENCGITVSCITHKGVKPSKSVRFGQHSVIAWQPLLEPFKERD